MLTFKPDADPLSPRRIRPAPSDIEPAFDTVTVPAMFAVALESRTIERVADKLEADAILRSPVAIALVRSSSLSFKEETASKAPAPVVFSILLPIAPFVGVEVTLAPNATVRVLVDAAISSFY